MIIRVVALLASALFALAFPVAASRADPAIDQIVEVWTKRQSEARTVKYVLDGQAMTARGFYNGLPELPPHPGDVPPEDRLSDRRVAVWIDFENNKIRKETEKETFFINRNLFYPSYQAVLSDGASIQEHTPLDRNTSSVYVPEFPSPELTLHSDIYHRFFMQHSEYPVFFAHGIVMRPGAPLAPKRLRLPPDGSVFSNMGRVNHQGRDCTVLRTAAAAATADRYFEVWVDVERDCSIVRWADFSDGKEASTIEIEHAPTEHGWLPKQWVWSTYDLERQIIQWHKMRVVSVSLNEPMDAALFHIEPAAGMLVQDNITDRFYREGGTGEPDVDVEELLAQRSRGASGTLRIVGIVIAAVVVAVILLGVARRWRRAKGA